MLEARQLKTIGIVGRWGGPIAPIDDIRAGNPATNPALLEHLTRSFIDSGFDMRRVMGGLLAQQWDLHRLDRDRWITILYENIDDYDFDQFHQSTRERDAGYYDYGSIMHYSQGAFSLDGGTSIESVPPGIPIGQRVGLSAADIDSISRLYGILPTQTTITTVPEGLTITVDGEQFIAPRAFNWAVGSKHNLSANATQLQGTTRDLFVRWTDGGDLSHTFTASADQTVVAAEFQAMALMSVGGTVTVKATAKPWPTW